jgi:hypothetical protein
VLIVGRAWPKHLLRRSRDAPPTRGQPIDAAEQPPKSPRAALNPTLPWPTPAAASKEDL